MLASNTNNNWQRQATNSTKTASNIRLTFLSSWNEEHTYSLWIKMEFLQHLIQVGDVSEVCSNDTVTVWVEAVGIWVDRNTNIYCEEAVKEQRHNHLMARRVLLPSAKTVTFVHYLILRSLWSGFQWEVWIGGALSWSKKKKKNSYK